MARGGAARGGDVNATVAGRKARGVVFEGDAAGAGSGFPARFEMPGGGRAPRRQPRYRKDAG